MSQSLHCILVKARRVIRSFMISNRRLRRSTRQLRLKHAGNLKLVKKANQSYNAARNSSVTGKQNLILLCCYILVQEHDLNVLTESQSLSEWVRSLLGPSKTTNPNEKTKQRICHYNSRYVAKMLRHRSITFLMSRNREMLQTQGIFVIIFYRHLGYLSAYLQDTLNPITQRKPYIASSLT